jgi:hypothetical protein
MLICSGEYLWLTAFRRLLAHCRPLHTTQSMSRLRLYIPPRTQKKTSTEIAGSCYLVPMNTRFNGARHNSYANSFAFSASWLRRACSSTAMMANARFLMFVCRTASTAAASAPLAGLVVNGRNEIGGIAPPVGEV